MKKEICPLCLEDEVYSKTLTDGLCLNCYNIQQEENRLAYIEARLDYEEGR